MFFTVSVEFVTRSRAIDNASVRLKVSHEVANSSGMTSQSLHKPQHVKMWLSWFAYLSNLHVPVVKCFSCTRVKRIPLTMRIGANSRPSGFRQSHFEVILIFKFIHEYSFS